jgi:hypothetical protein
MPDHIPKVQELGATSAPLFSAAYFIGERCKAYNDDFMKCKDEGNGRGELDCLKEGRKVTRCAASVYVASPILVVPSVLETGTPMKIKRRADSITGSRISTPTACRSSRLTGSASRTTTTTFSSAVGLRWT